MGPTTTNKAEKLYSLLQVKLEESLGRRYHMEDLKEV
jgi:hypothetical protein